MPMPQPGGVFAIDLILGKLEMADQRFGDPAIAIRAHGQRNRGARFVLWHLAQLYDLPTPITLLLSRGTLRHYAQLYTANRSGPSRQRLVDRFSRIEDELFG